MSVFSLCRPGDTAVTTMVYHLTGCPQPQEPTTWTISTSLTVTSRAGRGRRTPWRSLTFHRERSPSKCPRPDVARPGHPIQIYPILIRILKVSNFLTVPCLYFFFFEGLCRSFRGQTGIGLGLGLKYSWFGSGFRRPATCLLCHVKFFYIYNPTKSSSFCLSLILPLDTHFRFHNQTVLFFELQWWNLKYILNIIMVQSREFGSKRWRPKSPWRYSTLKHNSIPCMLFMMILFSNMLWQAWLYRRGHPPDKLV